MMMSLAFAARLSKHAVVVAHSAYMYAFMLHRAKPVCSQTFALLLQNDTF
jgi:hypothetical protein